MKKPRTGNSRTTQWRKEKKLKLETAKAQEVLLLKKEKTTEYVALGIPEKQGEALAEAVISNNNDDIERIITNALKSKFIARKVLDDMIINGDIEIKNPTDWAYARKALE